LLRNINIFSVENLLEDLYANREF